VRLCLIPFGLCGGDTSRTRPASAPQAHRPAGRPSGYDMAPDDFAAEMDRLWLAGQAAVRRAPRLHTQRARAGLRRARRGSRRPHPGAPAGQHVEPRRARGGPPLRRLGSRVHEERHDACLSLRAVLGACRLHNCQPIWIEVCVPVPDAQVYAESCFFTLQISWQLGRCAMGELICSRCASPQ
jgi:hypothetical protein